MFSFSYVENLANAHDEIDHAFDEACRELEEYVDTLLDACSAATFIEFAQQSDGFDTDECIAMIEENTIVNDARVYEIVELIEKVYKANAVKNLADIACTFVY
jgi:hypothetical protein